MGGKGLQRERTCTRVALQARRGQHATTTMQACTGGRLLRRCVRKPTPRPCHQSPAVARHGDGCHGEALTMVRCAQCHRSPAQHRATQGMRHL
jgi:hypothetical protein